MAENEKSVDSVAESEPHGTSVLAAAAYLMDKHECEYNEPIDEVKLHSLLYFAQVISYALYDKPLFPESLIGRPEGPFSQEAHEFYEHVYKSETQANQEAQE